MRKILAAAFSAAALAGVALAHTGHGETSGFVSGFMHPMGGLDHVLAMAAAGLYAASLGGRALWALPVSFAGLMIAGFAAGASGVALPQVEFFIGLSVIVLGVLVAAQVKMPVAAGMGVVGFFAIFHGHAHGAEMALGLSGAEYAAGFVLATAILHGAGLALGFGLAAGADRSGALVARGAGGAAALAGTGLLAGLI
jgi:urease accessory protein